MTEGQALGLTVGLFWSFGAGAAMLAGLLTFGPSGLLWGLVATALGFLVGVLPMWAIDSAQRQSDGILPVPPVLAWFLVALYLSGPVLGSLLFIGSALLLM